MKTEAAIVENVAGSEGPGEHHTGSRIGDRPYKDRVGFVEGRTNRGIRPWRYECDRATATIGRTNGNPSDTVIAADRRRSATVARPRAKRRGRPCRDLMPEHAKCRGAAWRNRHYSEIAAVELQRYKFVVDRRQRHRVAGRAGCPGRIQDVTARSPVDLNSHGFAVVGRKAHCPAGTYSSGRWQGHG